MSSNAAQAAVAGLVDEIVNDSQQPAVVADAMGNYAPSAVAPGDIMGVYTAPTASTEATEPEAAPAAEEPALPSWEADTTGIEDLFDEEPEPDFDDDDDLDTTSPTFQSEPGYEDDPDRLRAELAKAQKKIAHERGLRVKASEKNWRAEAAKRFPLADVAEIKAESRNALLRKAKEQHDRYAAKIKPYTDAVAALKAQATVEGRQEARQQVEAAWGKPTTGPQEHVVQASEDATKYDRSRFRSFHDLAAAKLKGGQYGPV